MFYGNMMRSVDNGYWYKAVIDQINDEKPEIAIIPDVRFKIEADGILQHGGYVIRVDRDCKNTPFSQDLQDDSETQLDDYDRFDYTINNDGSLEDLKESVIKALEYIGI
jgi:hypothetical protein